MEIFDNFVSVRCWKCDIVYGMPETFQASRQRDGEGFFCPSGHEAAYKETEADKLRRERDKLTQRLAQKDDEIARQRNMRATAERQAAAARGQITKIKKRSSAGTCPCCSRTFSNMAEHMKHQHPEFVAEGGAKVVPIKRRTTAI